MKDKEKSKKIAEDIFYFTNELINFLNQNSTNEEIPMPENSASQKVKTIIMKKIADDSYKHILKKSSQEQIKGYNQIADETLKLMGVSVGLKDI